MLALALLALSAAPSDSLVGQRFYDEAFAAQHSEPDREEWPSITFPSRGELTVFDGETERFSYFIRRHGDELEFHLTDERGKQYTRSWRWLDNERAETDLFWGQSRVVSRKSPTPWERHLAFGARKALEVLRAGQYRSDGGVLLTVGMDGGVRWASSRKGTFFVCRRDCSADAGTELCVKQGGRELMLLDGVFSPVAHDDACGSRSPSTR